MQFSLGEIIRNPASEKAWSLFILLPRLLLRRTAPRLDVADENTYRVLRERFDAFFSGKWHGLVAELQSNPTPPRQDRRSKYEKARDAIHKGFGLSKARQILDGAKEAPRNANTARRLQEQRNMQDIPLPVELLENLPIAVDLDHEKFVANVRSAKRGKSGGCSGMVTEHLRLLLSDEDIGIGSLEEVARLLAQGRVPPHAQRALALGRMSGLDKRGVDVRGITSGHTVRRLVARTLAQQYAVTFGEVCAPHQYALSVKAGIDAAVHSLKAHTDQYPNSVVLSVDGVGAYDNVKRIEMLKALHAHEELRVLLPFVRLNYACDSQYIFLEESRVVHKIRQAQGGKRRSRVKVGETYGAGSILGSVGGFAANAA